MSDEERKISFDTGLETELREKYQQNYKSLSLYFPNIAEQLKDYIPTKSIHFSRIGQQHADFYINGDDLPFYCRHDSNTYMSFLLGLGPKNFTLSTDPNEFCKYQVSRVLNSTITLRKQNEVADSIGQIHLKYANEIIRRYNEGFKEKADLSYRDVSFIPFCLMIGVGTGYQLDELIKRINLRQLVLLENDLDIFYASMHLYDWDLFLDKCREINTELVIILNDNEDELTDDIFSIFLNRNSLYLLHQFFIILHYQSEDNSKLLSSVRRRLSTMYNFYGFFDDRIFGISHTCYAISHNKRFVNTNELDESTAHIPVFIIGSGPSLDKDLAFIRKYQDKALIIACGTALDILYHAGVKPDFYACTERVYEIVKTLEFIKDKSFFEDIILLSSNVCHPRVNDYFEHTLLFNKQNEQFVSYLESNLNLEKKSKGIYYMNPLVGNMGLSGAATLGFKELYLFGLDNGKKVGTRDIHSSNSVIYHNYKWKELSETNMTCKGNFGGVVESNQLFIDSIIAMEQCLSSVKNAVCYNCSDGAFIKGARPQHSDDLDERFSKLSFLDKEDIKKHVEKNNSFCYDCSLDMLKGAIHQEIYNRIADNLIDILKERQSTREEYIHMCDNICEYLLDLMNNLSPFYGMLVNCSLYHYLSFLENSLYFNKAGDYTSAEKIKAVIIDFLNESKDVFAKLPDYIMEDHKKYYPDGKLGKDLPHCKAPDLPEYVNPYKDYDDPDDRFIKRYY